MNLENVNKSELRKKLAGIAIDDRAGKDYNIFRNLSALQEFIDAKRIYAFLPMGNEPDLYPVFDACFDYGKRIAVPVMQEDEKMVFCELFEGDMLIKGAFGIKEPAQKRIADFIPEIIIVPMVGFDENKNRLGRGKGCYDKYLTYGCSAIKIGVCYSDYMVDSIGPEAHDIPMDIIVTEKGVVR